MEGGKGRWWEVSRTAREAWFYVMGSAHRPNKSSESPSEQPFPALEASISGCGSTLTHIPLRTTVEELFFSLLRRSRGVE